jgi:hypothetical protein
MLTTVLFINKLLNGDRRIASLIKPSLGGSSGDRAPAGFGRFKSPASIRRAPP